MSFSFSFSFYLCTIFDMALAYVFMNSEIESLLHISFYRSSWL